MADNTRPIELEMVSVPVPMSVRMKTALETYADAHQTDGKSPSNAELMRVAIASVIKYNLEQDERDRAKYSQRKRYDTDEQRVAARKESQEKAKRIQTEAMELYKRLEKEKAIAALKGQATD